MIQKHVLTCPWMFLNYLISFWMVSCTFENLIYFQSLIICKIFGSKIWSQMALNVLRYATSTMEDDILVRTLSEYLVKFFFSVR